MDTVIACRDLTVAYQADPVLYQINADFQAGHSTAIVGPNGAGKSTLLKSFIHLQDILNGRITYFLDGKSYSYQQVRKRIAYVPQKASVDWDFPTTVLDVVVMGRYGHLGWFKRPSSSDINLAMEALEEMGMEDYADRQISQLSGGQRQRVFLSRALVQEAEIYLLDEPLAGVDIKTEKVIMDKLKNLTQAGKSVLIVHHDLNTVADYFDHVLLLNKKLVVQGAVDEVFTPENIEKTYQQEPLLNEELGDSYA